MKARLLPVALLCLIFMPYAFSSVSAQQQTSPSTTATRTATFDVKVVLLGFDEKLVDKEYLKWNSPATRYQLIQIPGISTNTDYSLNYEYVFPSRAFADEFVQFLQSSKKIEARENVIWNISYTKINTGYYWNYTHFPVRSSNTYYPADDVETWLVQHEADYGGFPKNGYVLVLADLSTRLPSTTLAQFESALQGRDLDLTSHFYYKIYNDMDLGIELNRRYMTAWGGHSRLFFADLSAGPEQTAEQLPIQLAAGVNSIDLSTTYGKMWLNEFLGDYLSGAVYNLFAPDLVYPISYASSYKIKVVILDNRTDAANPPLTATFDQETAVKHLQALMPWANVTAETKYARVSDYPDLQHLVMDSRNPGQYGAPPDSPSVDARPVYYWLSDSGQGHIKDFMEVKRDLDEYDIPVFAFAFSGEHQFGFTYKEMVARDVSFDRTIWGVALYDLVLISHSTHDFKRGDFADPVQPDKGFGFTNTVIHEVGHMLGLMHPFAFDPTENFVASVMAYYPYEDGFSTFDKDTLARGQADQLLRQTAQLLAETPSILINQGDISQANSKSDSAEKAYSTMNYTEAVQDSAYALMSAARAYTIGGGFVPAQVLRIVELLASFMIGVLVAYLLFRRKQRARVTTTPSPLQATQATWCTTCGHKLTWIPEYSRWYCYNCQKYQ